MENETNNTNTTNTTEEKKQNWFKQHIALCIIIAVVIVVAAVGVCFLFSNKGLTPEEVATKYVEAMSEGSSDKIMELTDLKGAYAWEKCDNQADKFIEEYNKISDADVDSYKDEMKKSLDTAMAMLKAFGGVQISLKDVEKPEELGKGLYKVKTNMKMEAFGNEQDRANILVVYNGKYVGTISE